ncbi:MAG TPA: RNA-binding S4 domain-containing protein [Beijerinckiaceae bacterium]
MSRDGPSDGDDAGPPAARQRLDKYLWFARMARTRVAAAGLVASGCVRVNGRRVEQPSKLVGAGDVLTIALDRAVRVLRVRAFAERRGPYEEARLLYDDLTDGDRAAPPDEEA